MTSPPPRGPAVDLRRRAQQRRAVPPRRVPPRRLRTRIDAEPSSRSTARVPRRSTSWSAPRSHASPRRTARPSGLCTGRGLRHDEVATVLGLTPNAVELRLRRARARLRRDLAPLLDDGTVALEPGLRSLPLEGID